MSYTCMILLQFFLPLQSLFIITATAMGALRPNNDAHKNFAKERSEQALLFLFNLLLMSTHMEDECLIYARAMALVYAAFR